MLHRIHQKLGTAGFTLAILALIAALGGSALAASGALTAKQKKEVTKIAKQFAGKPGATGPAGSAGSAGPAGPAGTAGKNGAAGPQGPKGEPWTAGGTLPSKATETGTWAAQPETVPASGGLIRGLAPISFTIPLEAAPTLQFNEVGFPTGASAEEKEHCPGTAAAPAAKAGFLCAYTTSAYPSATFVNETGSPNGEVLTLGSTEAGAIIAGTWAVTAP